MSSVSSVGDDPPRKPLELLFGDDESGTSSSVESLPTEEMVDLLWDERSLDEKTRGWIADRICKPVREHIQDEPAAAAAEHIEIDCDPFVLLTCSGQEFALARDDPGPERVRLAIPALDGEGRVTFGRLCTVLADVEWTRASELSVDLFSSGLMTRTLRGPGDTYFDDDLVGFTEEVGEITACSGGDAIGGGEQPLELEERDGQRAWIVGLGPDDVVGTELRLVRNQSGYTGGILRYTEEETRLFTESYTKRWSGSCRSCETRGAPDVTRIDEVPLLLLHPKQLGTCDAWPAYLDQGRYVPILRRLRY